MRLSLREIILITLLAGALVGMKVQSYLHQKDLEAQNAAYKDIVGKLEDLHKAQLKVKEGIWESASQMEAHLRAQEEYTLWKQVTDLMQCGNMDELRVKSAAIMEQRKFPRQRLY